jgi:hypothetical protein
MKARCPTSVAIVCALATSLGTAAAQTDTMCSKVEVRPTSFEARLDNGVAADSTPKVEITATDPQLKTVTVTAFGPMLGSMDSSSIKTQIFCTKTGVSLTATITRSEHYTGATRQNQLWRPVVTVPITLRSSEAIFETTWEMQLTNGKELGQARTPPYSGLVYPIRVTRTLRVSSPVK